MCVCVYVCVRVCVYMFACIRIMFNKEKEQRFFNPALMALPFIHNIMLNDLKTLAAPFVHI